MTAAQAREVDAGALQHLEALLTCSGKLAAHYQAQAGEHTVLYRATFKALVSRGAELQAGTRSRALAAALGRADADLTRALLTLQTPSGAAVFDVPTVQKAIQLLDAPRALRQARKTLARKQACHDQRITRLLEEAGLSRADVDGLTMAQVVSRVDKELQTGVGKHAKRFRTIEGMKGMAPEARAKKLAADRKASKEAQAAREKREAEAQPAVIAEEGEEVERKVEKETSEGRLRRRKLFGAVRRASRSAKAVKTAHEAMLNLQKQLEEEGVDGASMHVAVSGACAKRLRAWIAAVPRADLVDHVGMDMPRDTWRAICDLVHARPSDFQLASFLDWLYAAPGTVPDGHESCAVMQRYADTYAALQSADAADAALLRGLEIPYSLIRRRLPDARFSDAALSRLLRGISVTQLLWFMDDGLEQRHALRQIALRLGEGEVPELPFGKLMERLLTVTKFVRGREGSEEAEEDAAAVLAALRAIATQKLDELVLCLPKPVLVLGDRSASMNICVETSAIFGAMIAAASDATLVFFDHEAMTVPTPHTVADVIDVAQNVHVRGSTSPAVGLVDAYENRRAYASVLVITDEEENTAADVRLRKEGCEEGEPSCAMFAPLLRRYINEVAPEAQTTFISFLWRADAEGQMVSELRREGIEPMQFKMSQKRPDLTKIDAIFARMGAGTAAALAQVQEEATNEGMYAAVTAEMERMGAAEGDEAMQE